MRSDRIPAALFAGAVDVGLVAAARAVRAVENNELRGERAVVYGNGGVAAD